VPSDKFRRRITRMMSRRVRTDATGRATPYYPGRRNAVLTRNFWRSLEVCNIGVSDFLSIPRRQPWSRVVWPFGWLQGHFILKVDLDPLRRKVSGKNFVPPYRLSRKTICPPAVPMLRSASCDRLIDPRETARATTPPFQSAMRFSKIRSVVDS